MFLPKRGAPRNLNRRAGPVRVWRVPPALFRDPDHPEAFEGVSILSEVPGDLGLLIYQVFRDLHLWAVLPEKSGSELFAEGAATRRASLIDLASPEPALRADLESLSTVLRNCERKPVLATESALRVAQWAHSRSARRTAILFAQVASAASPGSASAALEAGRVAAANYRYTVAETWLRRAVATARREADMESYCEALTELSRVYSSRTSLKSDARARATAANAARMARRKGLRLSGARARFQLALVELAAGRPAEAEHQARYAYRLYSRQSSEAPRVLHLVAETILAQRVRTPEAIGILERVLPHRRVPQERYRTLMLLMRAAGAVRDKRVLELAWVEALSVIEQLGEGEDAAAYLLDLARAAADVFEHQRATEAARRALTLAQQRQSHRLIGDVGEFIEKARLRSLAPRPILD